jgi:hypothetical protein
MNSSHSTRSSTAPLLVLYVGAAAVAILWFLVLAIRSFYPVQAGAAMPRVDGGLLTQGALALVCVGIVVVLVGGAWSTRGGGTRRAGWLAAALALVAVLVVLALTTERFIHPVPAYSESPPVYSGEAGLWATYFWVAAAGLLATAVLLLARLPREGERSGGAA